MPSTLEIARSQPDSLKARILKGARRAFARHGYQGAGMRRLAAALEIDVSTLYYHWGGKRNLFDAVLEDLQVDFEERLRAWVRGSKDLPIEECFDLAVREFDSFFLDRDIVRVVLFSLHDENFAGKEWARRSQRQLVETFRTFAEKRLGARALPPEFDASVLALMAATLTLVGSTEHLAGILGVEPNGHEYRDLVIRSLRLLLGSFLAQVTSSPDIRR